MSLSSPKPAIDREHLDRYTNGDPALTIEILNLFQQQAEIWSRLLDPSADDKSWHDAAHSLKGSARGVGAWRVAELCEEAEKLLQGGESVFDDRQKVLNDLQNALRAASSAARAIVNS